MTKRLKTKELIDNYLNDLESARLKTNTNSWWHRNYDSDSLIAAFSKLDSSSFKRLVSSPVWNKYPSYTYNKRNTIYAHGHGIAKAVNIICKTIPNMKNVLISHSEGLLLCLTKDNAYGSDRLKAARRAVKSKDTRARLRAAKILPVTYVKRMLNDSSASVRNNVIKRIGIDNCAADLVDDSSYWIRYTALMHCPATVEESKERFEECVEEMRAASATGKWVPWILKIALRELAGRIPNEDILYYLNEADLDSEVREIISSKMQNHDWS